MFEVLGWLAFGLIAVVIAKSFMPGRNPGSVIITILLGITGAVIGGFIGRTVLGRSRSTETLSGLDEPGFLMSLVLSVVGAIVVLTGYRLIKSRSLNT